MLCAGCINILWFIGRLNFEVTTMVVALFFINKKKNNKKNKKISKKCKKVLDICKNMVYYIIKEKEINYNKNIKYKGD